MKPAVYIWVMCIAAVNGLGAAYFARVRGFGRYVAYVMAISVALILWLYFAVPHYDGFRTVIAQVLWVLPAPILFSLSPGLLVRKGAPWITTFAAGVLTTAVAAPLFFSIASQSFVSLLGTVSSREGCLTYVGADRDG